MALMTLEFMMTNMFEIASLNTNQPKQVNGQIRMIQSEAGWVEQP
jgi:hypothetical protein